MGGDRPVAVAKGLTPAQRIRGHRRKPVRICQLSAENSRTRDAQDRKKGHGQTPRGFFADHQARYLEGKCIELYLKSLLIKSGAVISENGKMVRKLQTDKLIPLCGKLGFEVSDSEKQTLDKLTDAVEFWGTYPIPTMFEKWRPNIRGVEGLPPIYWWSPADTSNYTNVVQRLRERAGPVDWQFT
jgi:hypothetical protein